MATGFSYEHKRNFEDSGNRRVILALRDKFSRVIDVLRCNDKSFPCVTIVFAYHSEASTLSPASLFSQGQFAAGARRSEKKPYS